MDIHIEVGLLKDVPGRGNRSGGMRNIEADAQYCCSTSLPPPSIETAAANYGLVYFRMSVS